MRKFKYSAGDCRHKHRGGGNCAECAEDRLFQIGLFALAEQLHMSLTGAAEPLWPDETKEVIEYLQKRLRRWKVGPTVFERYDNAVKELIEAVLDERDAREEP